MTLGNKFQWNSNKRKKMMFPKYWLFCSGSYLLSSLWGVRIHQIVPNTFLSSLYPNEFHSNVMAVSLTYPPPPPGQNGRNLADDIFKCIFVSEKFCILIKFHLSLFLRSNWQQPSIGLDNGLAPNRLQAIIWINVDPIHVFHLNLYNQSNYDD